MMVYRRINVAIITTEKVRYKVESINNGETVNRNIIMDLKGRLFPNSLPFNEFNTTDIRLASIDMICKGPKKYKICYSNV